MLKEELRVEENSLADKPFNFGLSIILETEDGQGKNVLEMIKNVWQVVAQWGRWCDEELGEWKENEILFNELPDWLKLVFNSLPEHEFENWLDDLHDRDWIWWSSFATSNKIKVDLESASLPVSLWTIKFILEKAGGKIIYSDAWKSDF